MLKQQKCTIDAVMDKGLNALEELFEVYNHVNEMIKEHNLHLNSIYNALIPDIQTHARAAP